MKILQIIPHLGVGGAEIMYENLIYELRNKNHIVICVCLYSQKTIISTRLENQNIDVIYLDKKNGFDFKCIGRLRKLIKIEQPDIIHTHLYALKYAILSAIGRKIKIIHTIHSVAQQEASKIDKIFNNFFFKTGKVIPVALSKEIKNTILEVYHLESNRVPIVFNGINLKKCIVKDKYFFDSTINILHIGRLSKPKNHKELIKAINFLYLKNKNIRLLLVGDGELKKEIHEFIKDNNYDRFIIELGLVDNVYPILKNADIFVLPSLYEGMPMTLIEAMGVGLPIVASNVGAIVDMIDNECGVLVEPNSESIAKGILELINNYDKRVFCGKNAKMKAVNFSSSLMAENYEILYKGYTNEAK